MQELELLRAARKSTAITHPSVCASRMESRLCFATMRLRLSVLRTVPSAPPGRMASAALIMTKQVGTHADLRRPAQTFGRVTTSISTSHGAVIAGAM